MHYLDKFNRIYIGTLPIELREVLWKFLYGNVVYIHIVNQEFLLYRARANVTIVFGRSTVMFPLKFNTDWLYDIIYRAYNVIGDRYCTDNVLISKLDNCINIDTIVNNTPQNQIKIRYPEYGIFIQKLKNIYDDLVAHKVLDEFY